MSTKGGRKGAVSQPLGLPISGGKNPSSLGLTNVGTPNHSISETYHDWGWFIPPIKMVMTGGWFMALGLPHVFFCWVCICWVTGFGLLWESTLPHIAPAVWPGFPHVVAGTRMFDSTLLDTVCWLVVWNMNFIFPSSWDDDPIWLPNIIFFSGVETTNQSGFRSPFQFAKERQFPWGYSGEDAHQVEHHILPMAPWNKGSREQSLMVNYAWI